MARTNQAFWDMPKPGQPLSPYELIKEAILDATLVPGQSLVESALAEWCGVSRTPVREALLRLEQDGIVERTDRGLRVKERSPQQILDIYDARVALEAAAARSAAERHTEFDRIRLEQLVRREPVSTNDDSELARINRDLHRGIWYASHNESLIDLLGRLGLHLLRYPETTLAYPGRWQSAEREHRDLVEAIIARDGSAAASIANMHFTAARDIRLKLWEQDSF